MFSQLRLLCLLILTLWFPDLNAGVRLPALFSNNMVLQRGIRIPVWGDAVPGEKILVQLGGNRAETTADASGKWMVRLKPMKAGGPYLLKIEGDNMVEFPDVLLGDVWICAGQSNMELPVLRSVHSDKEIADADHPAIRLFTVDHVANADSTRSDVRGTWLICNPKTVVRFSAVGYFFGRDLQKKLNVPVGLINLGWNATRIEAWTSREALSRLDFGKKEVDAYLASAKQDDEKGMKEYIRRLEQYDSAILNGTKEAEKPELPRPSRRVPSSPGSLYNYMIYPLIPYGIKGAIWYQGEANAKSREGAINYRQLLPTMIQNWRNDWGQGKFPFLFVQLPNFRTTGFWPYMRESMLQTWLSDKKTGMAVTIDVGNKDNIHPSDKQSVGYRLSLQALDVAYKQKNLESEGPLFKSMRRSSGKLILSFDHSRSGLKAKGDQLKGFKIAGSDQQFFDAEAAIINNKVVLFSRKVKLPVAVRYAWEDNPECSLYNSEDLPATPFRTDKWDN